jgi:DNA-binding transcriptional LysR family regulator
MKTKLDYYRVFYETARFESFSLAAKHLYISQSAISQCINQLENDLGTKLFIRSRRGITLTREGTLLFQKVESAMQNILQGETLLAQLKHLNSGSLIIAAGDTITSHYLLPFLEQFHTKYPNIRIEMVSSYSSNMLSQVKEGRAELAFVNLPTSDDQLIITPCLTIHDIFVCGAEQETKSEYTWEDITNHPLLLLETHSNSRNFLDRQFADKHIILEPQIEVAVHELLIRFASIHLGVACVVKEFSKDALEKGIIKEMNLNPPLPPRSIGCAYLKHNRLSDAAKAFLNLIGVNFQV